ncbi:MAG TPA: lactate racemase domain-containing protein, partial [Candidatus Udaeobacter sp.]|nr:lactate racemase domain-containing protein [Candidatus Udaeobacter sp.]
MKFTMLAPLSKPVELPGEAILEPGSAGYCWWAPEPALESPDLVPRLPDLLRKPTSGPALRADPPALLLIPDATRATFVRPMAAAVLAAWRDAGLAAEDCTILIAGGLHRQPTPAEVEELLGPEVPRQFQVVVHDADDPALRHLGATDRGTPILLPPRLLAAGTLVVAGGITPHYFAGWTGGAKGLVPGAAGRATILANHRLSVAPDTPNGLAAGCREGQLADNPVAIDLREAASHIPRPFLMNVVFGRNGAPHAVVTGELEAAQGTGVALARQAMELAAEPAPVVLVAAGTAGRERDLVQAHKVLRQGAALTQDGGTLIALAACPDGIGSDTLLDWFEFPDTELAPAVA